MLIIKNAGTIPILNGIEKLKDDLKIRIAIGTSLLLKKMKIYFDCGTEDNYGLNMGATELHETLDALKIPHEFHLYPGGHSTSYLVAHRSASFEFHWRVFHASPLGAH